MSAFSDRITPLIITFNEEANIARTLAPLGWAREILVIDSGSTDRTLEILARDPRIRVVTRTFDSFAGQCNFGLEQVRTEWALSLDADYQLSPELTAEIAALDPGADVAGYSAAFVYCVFGRPLRSTLYPPRTVLYRRACARYRDVGHGHKVDIEGVVQPLAAKIRHDDRKPTRRWFTSQIGYVAREADYIVSLPPERRSRLQKLRMMAWPAPLIMVFYTLFWRGYVLDGRAGLYYSLQRVLAELMLAVEIADRRLRG
ncbi:glycosyltransferase family 2 protein [Sphingomonas immobilis]|uniref:Glycosyltransferase family 2 protein n=1 Tax=Sphingomonas immobilis TaxID=3063997 RepID=A0ABT8ZTM8_9SPHN|nr:glycosyltransferase family 2 protein [Sphingomonas sp. CA1-15]MDO7840923.1 glycosyltransferase family 2 protein [Sphingomonas sp. CA1-15]